MDQPHNITIGEDTDLLKRFAAHEISIWDGVIESIVITEDFIDVVITGSLGRDEKRITLKFLDIKESAFYHKAGYSYNIERCKFFASDGLYYLSLDPADEEKTINPDDNDIILSGKVIGYVTS